MKTVVPLWTFLAYGAVGATTYLAADWLFTDRGAERVAAADTLTLQDTTPPSTSPESSAATEPESETGADSDEASSGQSLPEGEQEAIAEGDEAVDEILTELELIYQESDDNFIPTEPVSPDTTIDFPVDI